MDEFVLVQAIRYFIPPICIIAFWVIGFGVHNKKYAKLKIAIYSIYMLFSTVLIINFLGYEIYKDIYPLVATMVIVSCCIYCQTTKYYKQLLRR